jgi:hypothetical protein
MAVITTDTFNALRRYVSVRLQQGVPIVDADWNELDDVRKFEFRAFLKWFVGDGVPEGTDGFRIDGTGLTNDFFIRAGITGSANALSNVGRCIVDGLDVIIDADLRFTGQPLHASQPGSAALASALGVPQIQAMPNPASNTTVAAYLDVWERLVTPSEDPSLVHAGLGTESCARLKREWVVRVRSGTSVPLPSNPDFVAGHSYYALATIARAKATVDAVDVNDVRERRLLVPPASLISDTLGISSSEYRRGRSRPPVSLREAINALIRNKVPATPDTLIAPAGPDVNRLGRSMLFDSANGLVAVWHAPRAGINQVLVARLDLNAVGAGFGAPVQVTTGAAHSHPMAAVLSNGDLLIASTITSATGEQDIVLKRAPFGGLAAATEDAVAAVAGIIDQLPMVAVSGDVAVIFHYRGSGPAGTHWHFRRRRISDNSFLDAASVQLSGLQAIQDFHAARDISGNIWTTFPASGASPGVRTLRMTPASAALTAEETHGGAFGSDPFLLSCANGDVWLFWRENGIQARPFRGGSWQTIETIPTTVVGDRAPFPVEDSDGGIWTFFTRGPVSSGEIFFARRDAGSGLWDQPRLVSSSPGDDRTAMALISSDQTLWPFWASTRTGETALFFKRIFTAV